LAVVWLLWDPHQSKMIGNERVRGIRYWYRGFTIGDNDTVRQVLRTSPPQVPDWFIGEIIVLDRDAKVSSDRSRFEDSRSRRELESALRSHLSVEIEDIARNKSKRNSIKRIITQAQTDASNLKRYANVNRHISKAELTEKLSKGRESIWNLKKIQGNHILSQKEKNNVSELLDKIDSTLDELRELKNSSADIERHILKNMSAVEVYETVKAIINQRFHKVASAEKLITEIEGALNKKNSTHEN
jgi:hypothetical protein